MLRFRYGPGVYVFLVSLLLLAQSLARAWNA